MFGIDANAGTNWSSNTYSGPNHVEFFAFWHSGLKRVNYIRLKPRFSSGAIGFPKTFEIYYSDGNRWQSVRSVANMPTPRRNDDIVLVLPKTVSANGILIQTTVLGPDNVGKYAMQMAEFHAGYDAVFSQFSWVRNNGSSSRVEVDGVGSQAFDPSKIGNWNSDAGNPLLKPYEGHDHRNIYAPSIVFNGAWNIYFGGWDNSPAQHDEVYLASSSNNFASIGPHFKIISNGAFDHINNESVIKIAPHQWRMAYTTLPFGSTKNKPGHAISTDGLTWTPSAGSTSNLMTMTGYSGWPDADVNGGNAIYYDGTQYHMYWDDFKYPGLAMNYATSPDNINYQFQGTKLTGYVPQEIKSFVHNGTRFYLSGYHNNRDAAYYSLSTSISAPPKPSVLFKSTALDDKFITSLGFVTDGKRLFGALYGASSVSTLDQNCIFASWLQRKVTFSNTHTALDENRSNGPDNLFLSIPALLGVETGKFNVYDTDGKTLLKQTPNVTLLEGDIWKCNF